MTINKKSLMQFIKFGCVGVLNTVVDAILYTIGITLFKFPVGVAQFFSYFLATGNSYFFNSRWTFKEKKGKEGVIKFFALNALTLLISVVLINFFEKIIYFDTIFGLSVSDTVNKLILKIPIMFVTVLINFLGSKLWIFAKK